MHVVADNTCLEQILLSVSSASIKSNYKKKKKKNRFSESFWLPVITINTGGGGRGGGVTRLPDWPLLDGVSVIIREQQRLGLSSQSERQEDGGAELRPLRVS